MRADGVITLHAVTREEWARDAVSMVADELLLHDVEVPVDVRVHFADLGKRIAGITCPGEWVSDGVREVGISLREADPKTVLGIVAHECIHAAGCNGHHANFRRAARYLDLQPVRGKLWTTAGFDTVSDDDLPGWAVKSLDFLGSFPAPALVPVKVKKQTTRMVKVSCARCSIVWRAAAKHLKGVDIQCPQPDCNGPAIVHWPGETP